MQKDWGFSALTEMQGKRILFDTGNNSEIFAHNVKAKGIDLSNLDFAVLSHRHGDHMGGLNYVMKVNPDVNIFAPKEKFGVFGASLPGNFYRKAETLDTDMRYFDGESPKALYFGTPWPDGDFTSLHETTEIQKGFYIIHAHGD